MRSVIDRLWETAEPMLYITKDQFSKNLEEWNIEEIDLGDGGEVVVLTKGHELHFQTLGTKRPIPRKIIREQLQTVIDKYGFCTTHTPLGDERQHRFNTLIGFVATGDDEFDRHYRIERVR